MKQNLTTSQILIQSFLDVTKEKNISRDELLKSMEEMVRSLIRKKYTDDSNFEVMINPTRGEIQIFRLLEVVPKEELTNKMTEISLEEARKHSKDIELYEEYAESITIESFGRRAIKLASYSLTNQIRNLEKGKTYDEYRKRVGEIILGEVYQIKDKKDIMVNHNGIELLLPRREQIYKDRFHRGDSIRAIIKEVKRDEKSNVLRIIISRTSPLFLKRLFELEIPEVFDKTIEIIKIERDPGERSKVIVKSHDNRIDPLGACIGMKGVRIHSIVRELQNENIDVFTYTNNKKELIKKALQPAKVTDIQLNKNETYAKVYVNANEVAKAIGKGGNNIDLASKITSCDIEIYRDVEEDDDIDINEFKSDFGQDTIEKLHKMGCDSARAVMSLTVDDIVSRSDKTISVKEAENILKTIEYEFSDDEN